ncbi:hypothetical protein [Xanthomonas arboricola]|uniref:hypothetical protein n=1 Tax=Xanthomonas arboricola TaxID=56448 RepID=UPI000ABD50FC|nr:hypothetical protein [Xanthomonas arboricola]
MKSINTNAQTVEDTTKDDVKRLAEQEGNTYAQYYLTGKRPLVVHVRGDLTANVAG